MEFSDFKEVEKFNKTFPGAEAMLNVVEDALIEKLAMQRWPGVRANLDALFSQVKGRVRAALRKVTPFPRFCTAVYLRLSHHQELLGLKQELDGVEDLIDEFPQVKTTADSADLAGALLNRWLHPHSHVVDPIMDDATHVNARQRATCMRQVPS